MKENRRPRWDATAFLGLAVIAAIVFLVAYNVFWKDRNPPLPEGERTVYLNEAQQTQVYDLITPLVRINAHGFDDAASAEDFELVTAVVFDLIDSDPSQFDMDEAGETIVPAAAVTTRYLEIFGFEPVHGSELEDDMIYYDEEGGCYYVSLYETAEEYRPVITNVVAVDDTIKILVDVYRQSELDEEERLTRNLMFLLSGDGSYHILTMKDVVA